MGDTDKFNSDMMQRLHSSCGTSSSSIPKHPISHNQPHFSDNGKRFGIPPTSPYSQMNFNAEATHSRSMSQPSSFFSFDSLPPLSPSPFHDDRNNAPSLPPSRCNSTSSRVLVGESLPPRKSHRRSNSDIPSGFNSLPFIPSRPLERSISGGECSDWSKSTSFVKKESSCEREGEAMDDLFSAYMNLDNIDVLNSSEGNENMESSRANGGSDTEGESSSVNENLNSLGEKRASAKRRAGGGDIAPTTRHYRSVSVDSCFMEKLSFGDDSLNPPPSPGSLSRKASPTNSVDGNSAAAFSIEFKNGEFTAAEMKKIMANDKLAEMAMADPKRVKRILANRQSAARSKERKMRHIVELEHKVQTLQTEATTLSAQLTLLQRDMMGLTNQNNELKFRLQAMEQQAQLRDALNVALNGEVQRLKLAIGEASHTVSDIPKMQALNANMFQQLNISHLKPQNLNGTMSTKPESNQ